MAGKSALFAGSVFTPAFWARFDKVSGRVMADVEPGDDLEAVRRDANITAARARQGEIIDRQTEIMNVADADDGRVLSTDEENEIDDLQDEFKKLQLDIDRRVVAHVQADRLEANGRTRQGRRTTATADESAPAEGENPAAARRARLAAGEGARDMGSPARNAGNRGFPTFGHFANAVREASESRMVTVDQRLRNASASTIATEGAGADGGFAVPPDYRSTILERVYNEDALIQRTDQQISSYNSITYPTDMTTPWQTTGGIQAYWEGEAAAIPQSKPALETVTLRLHKLTALVPVTEELLEDAPAMGSYVERKAGQKIDFKVSNAILWGNGAGMPLGVMNSPALVTQAAESAQTAATINAQNVVKMMGRMPVENRRTAVWLLNPDAEAQLPLMTIANQPVYLPPGGLSGNMYGTLLGRPVIPHQTMQTLGTLGDIALVDLNSYITVTKSGGIKATSSIHLWFDQDLTAFKFTFRCAGQPWWSAAVNPLNGANTLSPFITLAAR